MILPPVLVTDGEQRAALAIVRSLGRAGYPVYVCSSRRHSLAGASRYVRGAERVPHPARDPGGCLTAVKQLVSGWAIRVVIPVTDASLEALLPSRNELHGVELPFPEYGSYRRISDKAFVLSEASRLGINVPRQVLLADASSSAELRAVDLRFPVVAKPSRSLCEVDGRLLQLRAVHAADAGELESALREMAPQTFPMLVQERLTGPGLGFFALRWNGSIVAAFGHRRLREKPPSGGVSVYCESVALDPHLTELSSQLLAHLDWQGVAMVEYKLDALGTPFLMEVNGRFWGSLQLAIDAGVDFPRLLLEACLGLRPEPALQFRTGVRSRWWWGDVDHLLARLVKSRRALSLPPEARGRVAALRAFLTISRSERNEVLRLEDPLPFIRETVDWLNDLVHRGP